MLGAVARQPRLSGKPFPFADNVDVKNLLPKNWLSLATISDHGGFAGDAEPGLCL